MSIVENAITPIVKSVVFIGLILWILYMIYWVLKKTMPNFNLWVKYSVFRRKYHEGLVNRCMEAIEKDMNINELGKIMLLKGFNRKTMKELRYIYLQVEKKLKGGGNKNEQFRQSNEQDQIPKI